MFASALSEFFSALVSVREWQAIIRKGLYRNVCHPSYTRAILIMIGMGVALRSWRAVLVLLLASFAVYGYRNRVEEEALVEKFGEEYRAYMHVPTRLALAETGGVSPWIRERGLPTF